MLVALAAAVLTLTGCTDRPAQSLTRDPSPATSPSSPASEHAYGSPFPVISKVPLPAGRLYALPASGNRIAWTVDDGVNSEVVAAYVQFAKDSGVRLTFFLNGIYPSWVQNAPALRPLVDSGQVQLGNHTFNHANLTTLSDAGIVTELRKNEVFIRNTYGVDAAPFYRPPYGATNPHSEAVAASIGYRTPVMWYGSLSDSSKITPDQVIQFASKWFLPHHIILGHANHHSVTTVYPQLLEILRQRNLQTVTLNDVFQT